VDYGMILTLAVWVSILLLMMCIWTALMFRLITTFDGSDYAVAKCERFFYLLCFLVMAGAAFALFLWIVIEYEGEMDMDYLTLCLIVYFAVYVLSAVFAVYRFSSNLMKLAKVQAQRSSVKVAQTHDHLQGPPPDLYLNDKQRRMTRLAIKYITLFSVAFVSSAGMVAATILSDYGMYFCVADQLLNIYLLYLQFAFQDPTYRTLCCCCDRVCGWFIITCCIRAPGATKEDDAPDAELETGGAAKFSPKTSQTKINYAD